MSNQTGNTMLSDAISPFTGKRSLSESDAAGGLSRLAKAARIESNNNRELKPYPFYYYRDLSQEEDPDPLMPVTPPGRVPNFAAKMYAILSRPDLQDVVSWNKNGRSWRIHKPREFEIRVIPSYFEHSKLSSFIRQANGWGFRRLTQDGPNKNSYYHEQFLRGLPHLIKTMKRPGVAEKKAMDAAQEPDLTEISKIHPLPEKAEDEYNRLEFTIQGGPKARMPIYTGSMGYSYSSNNNGRTALPPPTMPASPSLATTPNEHLKLSAFEKSIGVSENVISHKTENQQTSAPAAVPTSHYTTAPQVKTSAAPNKQSSGNTTLSALSAANQMAFQVPAVPAFDPQAAAQFAAGFAFATAFSQHQFSTMLGNFAQQRHH